MCHNGEELSFKCNDLNEKSFLNRHSHHNNSYFFSSHINTEKEEVKVIYFYLRNLIFPSLLWLIYMIQNHICGDVSVACILSSKSQCCIEIQIRKSSQIQQKSSLFQFKRFR